MDERETGAGLTGQECLPTPRHVDVDVTARCNLACAYCYNASRRGRADEDLPTRAWRDFLEECGRERVLTVALSGGEPFLRQDLSELVDAVVANRMRFTVLSNGGPVTEAHAAMLAASGRCDGVQVSVDGPDPEVHDAVRGAGAFALAVAGIRRLQAHGVPVTSRITVHRGNVLHLTATARLLLEQLGVLHVTTNAAGYLGACGRQLLLNVQERMAAQRDLVDVERKYPGRVSAQAGPLAEAHMWARMERARRRGEPGASGAGALTGCGCTRESVAVRHDGVYVPCSLLPHVQLGRVGRDALASVWREAPALQDLRRRGRLRLDSFAFCQGCAYAPYCTGNCPALAYSLTGTLNHPSPDACLRAFLEAGGRLLEGVDDGD